MISSFLYTSPRQPLSNNVICFQDRLKIYSTNKQVLHIVSQIYLLAQYERIFFLDIWGTRNTLAYMYIMIKL